jgi:hypothetical protein
VIVKPAKQGGGGPVLNSEKGELARFLENAWPVVAKDREWWRKTFDFCLEARASQALETKLISWNILADRVSSAALKGSDLGSQIHASLNELLGRPESLKALQDVLASICPAWDEERTRSLIGVIKGWNEVPSFPNKVALACTKVGAPATEKAVLNRRHKLVHEGELRVKGEEAIEYLRTLENTVKAILLKLLGHDDGK